MFITFEGGEGSGKSTAAKNLAKFFEELGYDVTLTHEPGGGTDVAQQIRSLIMNYDLQSYTEMMLFNAARFENLKNVVLPGLRNDCIVICDRFIDSSRVYQGILGDCKYEDYKKLEEANDTIKNSLDLIHTTFYFDIDPQDALNRITTNNRETNRFDDKDLDYHYDVQTAYEQLINVDDKDRFVKIDASQNEQNVLNQCVDALKSRLELKLRDYAPVCKSVQQHF